MPFGRPSVQLPCAAEQPLVLQSTAGISDLHQWIGVAWSPELSLFVAVSNTSPDANQVMTSPTGLGGTWAATPAAAVRNWRGISWSPELGLFVAVANATVGNRVMTSPDGINWTLRASADDTLAWRSVIWSKELGLFVAAAETSALNNIMTSPDGINWTIRAAPLARQWYNVAYSPSLGRFVICGNGSSGGNGRTLYSDDGINWTAVVVPNLTSDYAGAAWSPILGIFVLGQISAGADNFRFLTSNDGTAWTARPFVPSIGLTNNAIVWEPLSRAFFTFASSGNNSMATSPDGINWTQRAFINTNTWTAAAAAPELRRIVAVSNTGAAAQRVGIVNIP